MCAYLDRGNALGTILRRYYDDSKILCLILSHHALTVCIEQLKDYLLLIFIVRTFFDVVIIHSTHHKNSMESDSLIDPQLLKVLSHCVHIILYCNFDWTNYEVVSTLPPLFVARICNWILSQCTDTENHQPLVESYKGTWAAYPVWRSGLHIPNIRDGLGENQAAGLAKGSRGAANHQQGAPKGTNVSAWGERSSSPWKELYGTPIN